MQQNLTIRRCELARAHDVGNLLPPLISLLSDGAEFVECGGEQVNSAGADTRHYVYGKRSLPPGRSGSRVRVTGDPAEAEGAGGSEARGGEQVVGVKGWS